MGKRQHLLEIVIKFVGECTQIDNTLIIRKIKYSLDRRTLSC